MNPSRNISIYAGFAAMTVLAALIGIAVMESGDPNSAKSRSVIFAVVATWSILEAVPSRSTAYDSVPTASPLR